MCVLYYIDLYLAKRKTDDPNMARFHRDTKQEQAISRSSVTDRQTDRQSQRQKNNKTLSLGAKSIMKFVCMNVPVLIDEFCFDMTNVYE